MDEILNDLDTAKRKVMSAVWSLENAAVKLDAKTAERISEMCDRLNAEDKLILDMIYYMEMRSR
jgi:phage gp29-like protein